MDSLEDLTLQIKNCQKCPLFKTRKNTVPGEKIRSDFAKTYA